MATESLAGGLPKIDLARIDNIPYYIDSKHK